MGGEALVRSKFRANIYSAKVLGPLATVRLSIFCMLLLVLPCDADKTGRSTEVTCDS